MARVYVYTGSSKIDRQPAVRRRAVGLIDETVAQLPGAATGYHITGAQVGIDVLALQAALRCWPGAQHHVWCPAKPHDHRGVATAVREHHERVSAAGGHVQVHECLPGTDYRYRNLCMLQSAWHLASLGHLVSVVAYPLAPEDSGFSKYSGTWLCVRQAQVAGIKVLQHPLWLP
jgi:hypothetical protein